jgi:hypothetical protein
MLGVQAPYPKLRGYLNLEDAGFKIRGLEVTVLGLRVRDMGLRGHG